MMAQRIWALTAIVFVLSIAGCGNGLAKVSGVVTLDNQPIAGGPDVYGTVTFCRESGGAPAVGIIDSSGQYTLGTGAQQGVEPGTYLVSIAVKKIAPPVNRDAMPKPTLITPSKYASVASSGLRQEVQPGSNTCNFTLVSDGRK